MNSKLINFISSCFSKYSFLLIHFCRWDGMDHIEEDNFLVDLPNNTITIDPYSSLISTS
jgi:hypothetical protein